jgi:hypothetical protein
MMQAFAYHHLVPAKEWLVQVTPPGRIRSPWRLLTDGPVKLPAGGTAAVRLAVNPLALAKLARFELSEPPEGVAIQSVSLGRDGLAILLRAEAVKVKLGQKGNLILEAFTETTLNPAGGQGKAITRRVPLGTMPAIPFEIIGTMLRKDPQDSRAVR